jgi:predicted RNase H-like nuclease
MVSGKFTLNSKNAKTKSYELDTMKFIGVDFGWVSGATGLCCLQWENDRLSIIEIDTQLDLADVLAWIDRLISPEESALIALDAPTIIPNQTGTRLPDKLTHRYFGRYHAGCYPANLQRPFASRTVGLGDNLITKGFLHAPEIEARQPGRYQIEVFPHPAIVNLFNLDLILKYKKGKLIDRQQELNKLCFYITNILPKLTPSLSEVNLNYFVPEITSQITARQLKAIEDKLDSLICAYIAAYWWYWGKERNLVLGDLEHGYIIVPERIATEIAIIKPA